VGVFLASYFSNLDIEHGLLRKGSAAACLVIGALLLEASYERPVAANASGGVFSFMLWVGTISYSLYLVHFGIAEQIMLFLYRHSLAPRVTGIAGGVAMITLSLFLASLVHVFFERRIIRVGKFLIELRHKPDR
jgi:peptidoglycan/LPS O-acetylase OafA/YrhL